MENKRFYNFLGVIYEDDENFDNQFFNLTQEKDAIWIIHDSDINEETGEPKKNHIHFVIKLKNACTISALAKRLEVNDNMIEPIKKSLNGSLKYLIHYGNDNKYQYDKDDVQSNSPKLKRKFQDLVTESIPEVDKVISIQDFIESCHDYIDLATLGKYVQKINMWDAFRRNMTYFIKLIDHHNGRITAKRYKIKDNFYDN